MVKRFIHLSPARQRLIRLLQNTNFGKIESLTFKGGEPILEKSVRRLREVKFGSENGSRAEDCLADFELKQQVLDLLDFLDEKREGVIEQLEVRNGLPFRMVIVESACCL
jgi:ATP phosphoribosyltransferase regulatory subunit HisZ